MKKNRVLTLIFSMGISLQLYATDPTIESQAGVEAQPWGAEAMSVISKAKDKSFDFVHEQVDDVSKQIGMSIFEELTRFEIFKVEKKHFSGSINVQRRLFPNFDIFDSYTVVDTFELPSSIPLPALIDPKEIVPGVLGGLTFGVYGNLTITNIRQVNPLKMERLLTWASLKDELTHINPKIAEADEEVKTLMSKYDISKKDLMKQIKDANKEDNDYELDSKLSKNIIANYLDDTETKARFGKIVNIFASPLRLPLGWKGMQRLTPGEIVSYTANGLVQLAGNIGWNYMADVPLLSPRGQVSLVTYLNGTYRISIMKEDDRFSQVKLTRVGTMGEGAHFYPLLFGYKLFDGVAVMGLNVSKEMSITPFRFSLNKSRSETFDLVYRYDLTTESGRDCFDKAITGFFACSENNLNKIVDEDEEPGVQKLVNSVTNAKNFWRDTQFELKYLFKRYAKRGKTFTHAKIILPDGQEEEAHFVKNGYSTREKNWSTLFGTNEARSQTFQVSLDESKYEKGDPEGLTLELKYYIQDDSTTGREFNRYTNELNDLLGLDGIEHRIFEIVPTSVPHIRKNQDGTEEETTTTALYGDSQFYFRFQFNTNQLNKLIYQTDTEFKRILTQVYKLKKEYQALEDSLNNDQKIEQLRFLKAKKLFKKWLVLRDSKSLDELHKKLIDFAYEEKDAIKILNMIRWSVPNEEFAFHYNANNKTFGNKSDQGNIFFTTDTVTGKATAKINFDTIGPRTKESAGAKVISLESKRLESGLIELNFDLSIDPSFIFIDLKRHTLHIGADENRLILPNKNRFVKGKNTLVLDPKSEHKWMRELCSILKNSHTFKLGFAIADQDQKWSSIKSTDFIVRHLAKDPEQMGP